MQHSTAASKKLLEMLSTVPVGKNKVRVQLNIYLFKITRNLLLHLLKHLLLIPSCTVHVPVFYYNKLFFVTFISLFLILIP